MVALAVSQSIATLEWLNSGHFSPAQLFATSEPGVWYDPSDLTTMFQDSAGITPVTAPAQPVGRILDKSGRGTHATQSTSASRPTYGIVPATGRRNLLTFSEQFDNAAWTSTSITITANAVVAPNGTTTAEKIVANTGISPTLSQLLTAISGSAYTATVYAKAAELSWLRFQIDWITGTRVAWFNLSTGIVGTVQSGLTASISAVGNDWYRCSVTATSNNTTGRVRFIGTNADNTAINGDGTSGIHLWGAQLELGSTATAYQRVVTAFEVTEANVASLSYLSFDGIDDFMVTPTITPGTDKVQVFTGVRKLSDATTGVPVELSTNAQSVNGAFTLFTATSSGAEKYNFLSKGTSASFNGVTSSLYSAPVTNVVTSISEISTDTNTMRINGSQVATNSPDQGTGNYLAYPMYIGRRGGTSLPFNGQIYGLITRFGANLNTSQLVSTEGWMNTKTRAY